MRRCASGIWALSSRSIAAAVESTSSSNWRPTRIVGSSEVIGSWKTAPRRSRRSWRSCASDALGMSTPSTESSPSTRGLDCSGSRPNMVSPKTLLPEPDSPTRPRISPDRIWRSIPLSTGRLSRSRVKVTRKPLAVTTSGTRVVLASALRSSMADDASRLILQASKALRRTPRAARARTRSARARRDRVLDVCDAQPAIGCPIGLPGLSAERIRCFDGRLGSCLHRAVHRALGAVQPSRFTGASLNQ